MKKLMVRVVYPNGMTASWAYDANGQLLQVKNAFPTNIISQYDYVYDAAGRHINVSKSGTAFNHDDLIAYGYNIRSELTNAVAAVDSNYRYAYDFDDIGNRETSSERGTNAVYAANQLNQYTMVGRVVPNAPQDAFVPQFDDDGNQTLIKTATGIWQVTYNGENRPILWQCVSTNSLTPNSSTPSLITMSYDRMGRRVTKNDQRFIYDGYLQIANFEHQTSNIKLQAFIWDPTEPVATRPLAWLVLRSLGEGGYYTHDGNKNVSEVVASDCTLAAHYEYAPFGAVTTQRGAYAASNPWRFSSEYAEDDTATVYYNYRHYEPVMGRWMGRDPMGEHGENVLYVFSQNQPVSSIDFRGMNAICTASDKNGVYFKDNGKKEEDWPIKRGKDANGRPIIAGGAVDVGVLSISACCKCIPKSTGGPVYELWVSVESSYLIRIVKVGATGFGRLRTQSGYDRTLAHENLHVSNFRKVLGEIMDILKTQSETGEMERVECEKKRKLVVGSRARLARDKWNIAKMNEATHSGDDWKDWKKNNGKTETDPELW